MTAPSPTPAHFLAGPVLGIETSCDETAVAVVAGGRVLTSRVSTQIPVHRRFGGVVPEIASRNHLLTILPTVEVALADVGLRGPDLAGVAVTNRPGLMGALLVGVETARTLAHVWQVPLLGVHHIEAHCWAVMLAPPAPDAATPLTDWARPQLPFLALAVSGGHTSLMRVEGPGRSTLLGATLDDAAGEALDKFGKLLGLPYPAGPHVDQHARGGDRRRFSLPRGLKNRTDLAMSFSGVKTAGRLAIEALQTAGEDPQDALEDLCASYQDAVVTQLVRTTLKAARAHTLRDVVVAGGVAANSQLRADLQAACAAEGRRAWLTPRPYCTDNAAMIAGLGSSLLAAGERDDPLTLDAMPTVRPSLAMRKQQRDAARPERRP